MIAGHFVKFHGTGGLSRVDLVEAIRVTSREYERDAIVPAIAPLLEPSSQRRPVARTVNVALARRARKIGEIKSL